VRHPLSDRAEPFPKASEKCLRIVLRSILHAVRHAPRRKRSPLHIGTALTTGRQEAYLGPWYRRAAACQHTALVVDDSQDTHEVLATLLAPIRRSGAPAATPTRPGPCDIAAIDVP
jgi:hypothetical protein